MSYIPIPNPLPVELKVPLDNESVTELLQMMVVEMRLMNIYLYELPRLLNSGYDFTHEDEPDQLRTHITLKDD